MKDIINKIRIELRNNVDEKTRMTNQNFFKEKIKFYGVKVSTVNKISKEYFKQLKNFTKSKNRWIRRAAAVTLIIPARKGKFLIEILEIADSLLLDKDDLVQKGYGWMLKAASESNQQAIFDFVIKNKSEMPRTSLRYAIGKMPKEQKEIAMAK